VKLHNNPPPNSTLGETSHENKNTILTSREKMIIMLKRLSHINLSMIEKRVFQMYVKEVLVQNKAGLHARPATFFIQKANEYKATIWVEKEERRVNAKSLLGVLSLGIIGGTTIKIIADGADETEAVEGLAALVESGFAE